MAVPTLDAPLASYSTNFNTRGVDDPQRFALTAAQMALYTPLHQSFIDALAAQTAGEVRNKALTAAKNQAKSLLLPYARELYAIVQASTTVSNEHKALMGVHVRQTEPTPVPPPGLAPVVTVKSVFGRIVRGNLRDASTQSSRRRPINAKGALILSAYGPTPPPSTSTGWKVEGQTGKTSFVIQFGDDVQPGTPCYITALWYNERGEYSPASDPITTYLQIGGTMQQAA